MKKTKEKQLQTDWHAEVQGNEETVSRLNIYWIDSHTLTDIHRSRRLYFHCYNIVGWSPSHMFCDKLLLRKCRENTLWKEWINTIKHCEHWICKKKVTSLIWFHMQNPVFVKQRQPCVSSRGLIVCCGWVPGWELFWYLIFYQWYCCHIMVYVNKTIIFKFLCMIIAKWMLSKTLYLYC